MAQLLPTPKLKRDSHARNPQGIGMGAIVHGPGHHHPTYA
jgi:hypothetical protein